MHLLRNYVVVQSGWAVAYAQGEAVDALSEDDRAFLGGVWFEHDGSPAAMYCTSPTYRQVPLDELAAYDVDEDLIEDLEFYAHGGTWEPYVVEDTPRSRALVETRLRHAKQD